MPRLSSKLYKDIIINLIYSQLLDESKLADAEYVDQWTANFVKTLPSQSNEGVYYKYRIEKDELNGGINQPVIIHHIHGIDYEYKLTQSFMHSTDYHLLEKLNTLVGTLVEEGGYVMSGSKKFEVKNFHDAYNTLMNEGFAGVKIQRYKGLGEMSAEQLSDTTMNPDTRTLLRVSIEDAMEADRILSELMGDEVEARRTFISENSDQATLDI